MKNLFTNIFYCLFLLLLLSSTAAFSQASYSATVSPTKIGKDETFELRLMVDNAKKIEQISPPDLKQFMIVAGPVQETGTTIRKGLTLTESGISYILKPYKPGNYTIGKSTAKADNKILESEPIKIEVVKESSINTGFSGSSFLSGYPEIADIPTETIYDEFILKKKDNIPEKINKNLFIKVEVSKQNCYIGEPVVVTYKLYTRLKTESNFVRNPSFGGFSVVDLPLRNGNDFTKEKFEGRDYNVYTLRKAQLYPLQAGDFELDSAEVDNSIHFIKEEYVKQQRELLARMGTGIVAPDAIHTEKVNLFSKPVVIHVSPLPIENKPANYKGAVGQFTVLASLEKKNINTDESGKLKIIITGEGNFMMVNFPEIKWPANIEPFDPVNSEELNKETIPISGIKYFEYTFIVKQPGNYTLPPVALSYFNTKEKAYRTVTTDSLTINVVKGTGKPAALVLQEKSEREQFFEKLFTHRWWIAGPVAIIILMGLLYWIKKEMKKDGSEKIINPDAPGNTVSIQDNLPRQHQLSKDVLAGSGYYLELKQAKEFYKTLNKEWQQFLSVRFQIPIQEINKVTITDALSKGNFSDEIIREVVEVMENLEWELYSPLSSAEKMDTLFNRAKTMIQTIS